MNAAQVEAAVAPPEPDENIVTLPADLADQIIPRRGGATAARAPAAEAAAGAARELAGFQHEFRNEVLARLQHPGTDPVIADAMRRYVSGEPDPLGAAAVATTVALAGAWGDRTRYPLFGPGWAAQHGPVFAAEAAADVVRVLFERTASGPPARFLLRFRPVGESTAPYRWLADHVLPPVRAALATASDKNYALAVSRLAQRRADSIQRAVAAFLVPTETAWVEESCDEAALTEDPARGSRPVPPYMSGPNRLDRWLLLGAVGTTGQLSRLAPGDGPSRWGLMEWSGLLPTLVDGVGPAAAPVLARWIEAPDVNLRRLLLGLLAGLPTDEAFGLLLDRVDEKPAREFVLAAMDRFPRRAARVLADAAGATPGRAARAARLLRAHLVTHPSLVETVLPSLPAGAKAGADAVLRSLERWPDAPAEQVPELLTSPPWTRRRTRTKPAVLRDLTVPADREIVWAPGEQARWAARASEHSHQHGEPVTAADLREVGHLPLYRQLDVLLRGPLDEARPVVRDWSPHEPWGIEDWGRPLLARFGVDAVPMLLAAVTRKPYPSAVEVLGPVLDGDVSAAMASMLARLKSSRSQTMAYFARHGLAAVPYLVPPALGPAGPARTAAGAALRLLATRHGRDDVVDAAGVHGEPAADGMRGLLAQDPLELLPARIPPVPDWADLALLPQIRMRDRGCALPAAATGHLLTMLALGKPGEPYGGVPLVTAACDPDSLADFAWALFQSWQDAELPAKEGWVLTAQGVLGNDETARRLAPLIRVWPGESGHQRAVAGLDVLAAIGTDVALLHLNAIARKVKFAGLRARAQERIDQIANDRNLSADQLSDRLVPDLGLAADGSLVLDVGPRQFTVGFDEQLKPYVSDPDGKPRKDLPRPRVDDDAEAAEAARRRFAALKKDARTIAADQIRRLEHAMVARRRWTAAEFTGLFVEHPLLWHVVRRLVWATFDGPGRPAGQQGRDHALSAPPEAPVPAGLRATFRVAEDRTFADADDEAFALPPDATVGLPHPVDLGDAVPAWSELFADYEILQPFPQLARTVFRFTDAERGSGTLSRFEGVTVPVGKVLGLVRRGWQRDEPEEAGLEWSIAKPLPDGRVVSLCLDPGILVGNVMEFDEQTLGPIGLAGSEYGDLPNGTGAAPFATLDPIAVSELIADLTEVVTP